MLFWNCVEQHQAVALVWAIILLLVGLIIGNAIGELWTNPLRREWRTLRRSALFYLQLSEKDYLPTSKQAEAARILRDACSIGL